MIFKHYTPEKYLSENYVKVNDCGVYHNLQNNDYCLCFETDTTEQYPLEDLLDMYFFSCGEYYGNEVIINNETKILVEFETDSEKDLKNITDFCSAFGKEIVNFTLGDGVAYLGISYGLSDITINNIPVNVPVVSYHDQNNKIFETKEIDLFYKDMFTSKKNFEIDLNNIDLSLANVICIKDDVATLVVFDEEMAERFYCDEEITVDKIIFDKNGFKSIQHEIFGG